MHSAPHRPGSDDGALLHASPIDVERGQAAAASPEAEPPRARVLRLDAARETSDIGRMGGAPRPVQELSGRAKRRQARGVDDPDQGSWSCEYAIDWKERR
jgi:hypothetical protein